MITKLLVILLLLSCVRNVLLSVTFRKELDLMLDVLEHLSDNFAEIAKAVREASEKKRNKIKIKAVHSVVFRGKHLTGQQDLKAGHGSSCCLEKGVNNDNERTERLFKDHQKRTAGNSAPKADGGRTGSRAFTSGHKIRPR